MVNRKLITTGFLVAGLTNIAGVLFFTQGFTNTEIMRLNPEVFSLMGGAGVILWGLAFISVARKYDQVRWLVAVFALEKLVFFLWWIAWLFKLKVAISELYQTSFITGLGLMSYGPVDLMMFLFFAWVWKQTKHRPAP